MKLTFKLILVCLIGFSLLNCNKDDSTTPEPENKAPAAFNLTAVANGSTAIDVNPTLNWETATDPEGDTVKYDVYIDDTQNPSTLVAENITTTSYVLEERLSLVKKYYWKVIAKDTKGKTTTSNDTYNFTTRNLNIPITPVTVHAQFSKRFFHTSIVFQNKLWVIGGGDENNFYNDIWSSTDGINWIEETPNANFSKRGLHNTFIFNNKIWVVGGRDSMGSLNDIWYSSDGKNWIEATQHAQFPKRESFTSVVFDNKIWVIGGIDIGSNDVYKDVWFSSDGINWTQATSNAPFSNIAAHKSLVFDNKIWIIDGVDSHDNFFVNNWYSSDGINWAKVIEQKPYVERIYHTITVFDDNLWLFGGANNNSLNDIWYSSDGNLWTQLNSNNNLLKRYGHTTVAFKNKLWIIGGVNSGGYLNDVWAFD